MTPNEITITDAGIRRKVIDFLDAISKRKSEINNRLRERALKRLNITK